MLSSLLRPREQLQKLYSSLSVAAARNEFSPTGKLPPETLTNISEFIAEPRTRESMFGIVEMTHVFALIVGHLRDCRATLRGCALVSRTFRPRSQAHLFDCIQLRNSEVLAGPPGNIDAMRADISSDCDGPLSRTRNLSISLGPLTEPHHLEGIYDYLIAFKNVREPQVRLIATRFVEEGRTLASRYFSHFRQRLYRLHLETSLINPGGQGISSPSSLSSLFLKRL